MLNHKSNLSTQFNQNNYIHSAANDAPYSIGHNFLSQLAPLAKQNRWILFTADALLPTSQELKHFDITVSKVVKIKSSTQYSEFDVILKVLAAHNASAIVASDQFTSWQQQQIQQAAQQVNCQVFFMNATIRQTFARAIH